MFWALFDGLSSWVKENKPNTLSVATPSLPLARSLAPVVTARLVTLVTTGLSLSPEENI